MVACLLCCALRPVVLHLVKVGLRGVVASVCCTIWPGRWLLRLSVWVPAWGSRRGVGIPGRLCVSWPRSRGGCRVGAAAGWWVFRLGVCWGCPVMICSAAAFVPGLVALWWVAGLGGGFWFAASGWLSCVSVRCSVVAWCSRAWRCAMACCCLVLVRGVVPLGWRAVAVCSGHGGGGDGAVGLVRGVLVFFVVCRPGW